MKKPITTLLFFCIFTLMTIMTYADTELKYTISMEQPHTHYFDVEMEISGLAQDSIDIKMATWTPGSYLIREFSRKVEAFEVQGGNRALAYHKNAMAFRKISKNTWRIDTKNAQKITIKYKVYSFEWTVRTSILDASHAYINPASVLMYVDGQQQLPSTVHIKPHSNFKKISTSLKPVDKANKWVLKSPNYDILVDSPIEIGNQETVDFVAENIPHHLAVYGGGNYDRDKLVADTKKIVTAAKEVFGQHPCEDYTIIVHNTEGSYGGLEHLSSTSLIYPRWNYMPDYKYERWLGLMSHEYFHLWNVKRLRPKALGPFDYENENYTQLLWVMEGTTSYYDDLLLRRADLMTAEKYLKVAASNVTKMENTPGSRVQSVADASFDAWIKYYRSDENFNNCCVSYYMNGAVVSMLLDLEIMHSTKGEKSLDDVMRAMYERYYLGKKRGFTDDEYQAVVEEVAGKKLDDFWRKYVYGTEQPDYQTYFNYVGLRLMDENEDKEELALGVNLSGGGKLTVRKVTRGTCGYEHGLNVNDEIIAIDGYRVSSVDGIGKVLQGKKAHDKIDIMISRDGRIQSLPIELAHKKEVAYKLVAIDSATDEQKALYKKWLREDFE